MKLGQMRNSDSFRSLEERVGFACENIKVLKLESSYIELDGIYKQRMKLIRETWELVNYQILSFFFRTTPFRVWHFSNLIKCVLVSFKRKDFYLVPCRRKYLLRDLAQRRASMRLYESPKRWGARPRHLRPPARPSLRTNCFLRARNRARFTMRLHRAFADEIRCALISLSRSSAAIAIEGQTTYSCTLNEPIDVSLDRFDREYDRLYINTILLFNKIYIFLLHVSTPLPSQDRLPFERL